MSKRHITLIALAIITSSLTMLRLTNFAFADPDSVVITHRDQDSDKVETGLTTRSGSTSATYSDIVGTSYSQTSGSGFSDSRTSACSSAGCGGVVNSRSTGWDALTVTSPNMAIYSPEITYGSVHIPAATYFTGDAAVGSNYYIHTLYADRDGTITIDGVRTQVHKGDVIARIPVNGIPMADGTFDEAWGDPAFTGKSYRKNGYGELSSTEVRALYDQLVATGMLENWLNGIITFTGFGGADGIPVNLAEGDVSGILELLKKLLEEAGETPPAPSPYSDTPLLSCHGGEHWGDTEGKVEVVNMTTGTGWTGLVWARPGDSVRFRVQYCWGAGAVTGTRGSSGSPWAIMPGSSSGDSRVFGAEVSEYWFQLSATQNDKYLFGENEQVIGTSRHNLTNPHATTIGGTGAGVSDSNVDKTGDYAFTVLSPSTKGSDANKYACTIFDFPPYFVQYGYQIPGVATGGCPAISNNGGIMSDVSNSPGVISQTITYNRATAWQMWKHQYSGTCINSCTYQADMPPKGVIGHQVATPEQYNTLTENNINQFSNWFQTVEAARGAGGNAWGLIQKWSGDTATHRMDCESSSCSCGHWHYWCSESMGCCSRKCNCYYWSDERGRHEECDSCPYGCYQSCDGDGGKPGCACASQPGNKYYFPEYNYSTGRTDRGVMSSTASVNVPYSYRTSTKSNIQAGEVIYLGEGVTSHFDVSILPRSNTDVHNGEAYATLLDGEIRAVEFIVDMNDNISNVSGSSNYGGDGPCGYYRGMLNVISGCNTIWSLSGGLNPEGRYAGTSYSNTVRRVVPDLDKYPVGSRYCVAVGISHSDSHGVPDSDPVSGMSNPSNWRISGASCRTIAKKPNFQVWNGTMYTNGSITTSITRKHVSAELGDDENPTGAFGSWDEFYVTAALDVSGFSSGAALGYYGKERNTSLGLQGGNSPNVSECDIGKMTISNAGCYGSDAFITGSSRIAMNNDMVLERIYSRYTNDTASNGVFKLENGATYAHYNGSINTSAIRNLSGAGSTTFPNTQFTASYIRQTKSSVNSESEQTTSNYASNALVIRVKGDLTIDTNICTGTGDCSAGNNGQYLALQSRNSDYYNNIYSLPQVIIIVDGNITVTQNVNQIDAWLIAPSGNINTCAEFSIGSGSADTCMDPLVFNGPIVAKSMTLNRTAGANPGPGTYDTGDVLYKNLANDGSITPGEIFNLRPDALYWAFSQSQRFSQANVTYTRELAPRY